MRRGIVALLLLGACQSAPDADALPEGTMRIADQSGAEFLWVCQESNHHLCKVHRIAGVSPRLPECFDDERPEYTYGWGRFVEVFGLCRDADGSGWSWGDWGRFLVCEQDADCPQLVRYGESYECRAGFCQNVDLVAHPPGLPDSFDMTTLCHGDAARYDEHDLTADDYPTKLELEIEAACPHFLDQPHAACESIPDGCPDVRD
jgi:hypothetical protein